MKESSRFYSSLGLLIVLNVIIKPIWIFGIDRQVQNTVGLQDYGQYFSLFNLSVVFSFLLDWGFTPYLNRQLASQPENFIHRSGNFLLLKLFFFLLFAGIILLVAMLTGIERWDILVAVIFIQALTSLFIFFRAIVTAQQWFKTDAWLSILDKSLMLLLCGGFLISPAWFGPVTIERFLWIQVACTGCAVMTALFILIYRKTPFHFTANASFIDRKLLLQALPYGIIVLLMSVHYRLDGFLLERMHPEGAMQAGVYAGAYRLLDAANMIGFLFASFLLPFIARQQAEKKDISEVVLQIRHLLLLFAIGISCVVVFLAPWLQQLLYRHNDQAAVDVLRFCLPSLIGYSLVSIYGTVLTATGHIRLFCGITLSAILLNIVLNLVLIPSLGAKGCCIAALASQSYCGVATMFFVKQKLNVGFDLRSLLLYVVAGLLLSFLFYEGRLQHVNNWLLIAAGVTFTVFFMVGTKLLRPAEWIASLRKSHL